MSNSSFSTRFLAASAAALLVPLSGWAQATTPEETAPAPAAGSTPAKLPYGVEDVLKLSRAKVNEDVVLSFVHNSGTIYNLSPTDIVYLKEHGVSDRVLNEMLTQRQRAATTIAGPSPLAAPEPEAAPPPDASAAVNPQPAPVYDQPPPQTQLAPTASGPSSVYVIPYPTPARPYYYGYYYPYYGPYYYGYYRPAYRYGYGHGWHYGYWHGGHWHH
jgi:hypothetical protein